ncbi:hypothetical protein JCM6882_002582 [Rhodosporidiobolus microsporus]
MSASTLLFGAYLLLPPDSNVFAYVAAELHDAVHPRMPDSFDAQAYTLMGIFAVETALMFAAYCIRVWKLKNIWPFRLHSTARGTYISPHFVLAWQLWSAVYLPVLMVYLYRLVKRGEGNIMPNYLLWLMLPWVVIWQAAWLALWSLAVALSTPIVNVHSKQHWISSPVCTFFLVYGAICPAVVATTAGLAQHTYDRMLDSFDVIYPALVAQGEEFLPSLSSPEIQARLTTLVSPFQSFLDRQKTQDTFFRVAWSCWAGAATSLCVLFLAISTRYFLRLSRELATTEDYTVSRRFTASGSFKLGARRGRSKEEPDEKKSALRTAYHDLIGMGVIIGGGAIMYGSICIALAALGSKRANEIVPLQTFVLMSCWWNSTVGAPISIISVIRAVQYSAHRPATMIGTLITAPPSSGNGSGSGSSGDKNSAANSPSVRKKNRPFPVRANSVGSLFSSLDGHELDVRRPPASPAFRIEVQRTVVAHVQGNELRERDEDEGKEAFEMRDGGEEDLKVDVERAMGGGEAR